MTWETYSLFWTKLGGFKFFIPTLAFSVVSSSLEYISYLYLSSWSANFIEGEKWSKFITWAIFMMLSAVLPPFRILFVAISAYFLSRKLHAKMVYAVLHSRIEEFINRVPCGRILNRFTNDLEKVDIKIAQSLSQIFYHIGAVTVNLGFYGYLIGWEIVACLIVMVCFSVYYQRLFMHGRREFMRMESITLSPVASLFGDISKGLPFIRAYGKIDQFFTKFGEKLENHVKNSVVVSGLASWYQIRILFVSVCIVLIPSYTILLFVKRDLIIEDVVIFIMIGTGISQAVSSLLEIFSNFEGALVSIERCTHFEKIQAEKQYKSYEQDFKLVNGTIESFEEIEKIGRRNKEKVISEGRICFESISAKYATNPNPVLKELNFEISPGEKIGVIGRTGSGKSSLIKLLWRSLDPSQGRITMDGKDITEVDLKSYRSEIMVVTQETALIEGTLRENIDITLGDDKKADARMDSVLRRLGFEHEEFKRKGLDMRVGPDGSNLSVGEKQMISFSRAIIAQKRVTILDEATASIDIGTEERVQKCFEEEMRESTVIVIAHRLQTIMKSDRILVLDRGEVLALDSPQNLLNRQDSYLSKILKNMTKDGEGDEEE